jgi:hypothetical protein
MLLLAGFWLGVAFFMVAVVLHGIRERITLVSFWLLAVLPLLFAASCAVIFHAEWKRRRSEYWQSKLDESGSAGTRTRLLLVLGGLIAYGAGAFLTQLVYDDLARRLFGSQ